ncbi:MAG: aldo/keto reductase [Lachnospiraceae bacterium]|nr:aldo/keto reductase [Lachnospiraceae bacterium]
MYFMKLGNTGIETPQNAFGALPVQRVTDEVARKLLRKAFDGGMTYFDTARYYTDSEHKLGLAFEGMRDRVTIATKTGATNAAGFQKELETSLRELKTDHIDVYQFHNPAFCPKPGDESGISDVMLKAKQEGKVLHIGITNHRLAIAKEAVESGLYETLQFPFSYLSGPKDLEIVKLCRERGIGFVAMKALAGGLITDSAAAYAYIAQFDNVLPIWGIQREKELDEWLSYMEKPPVMDERIRALIKKDVEELSGEFCRGCGYCMPCPAGIEINNCARMSLMIRRAPTSAWLNDDWKKNMAKIEDCLHCNACAAKCPYGLDTPALLQKNLEDYRNVLAGKVQV